MTRPCLSELLRPRRLFGFEGTTDGEPNSWTVSGDPGVDGLPPDTATDTLSDRGKIELQGDLKRLLLDEPLAAKAVDDFLTIAADLIVSAGPRTAASYDAKLKALIERLANHPESGSPRPKLGRSIRLVVISPYVVFDAYDSKPIW